MLIQRRVRPQHKGLRPDTLFTTITSLAAYPPTKVPPILCYRSRLRGISFLPALIEHYRAAGGRGRVQRGGKRGGGCFFTYGSIRGCYVLYVNKGTRLFFLPAGTDEILNIFVIYRFRHNVSEEIYLKFMENRYLIHNTVN